VKFWVHLAEGGETWRQEAGGETIGRANPNDSFDRGICVRQLGLARVDRGLDDLGHAPKPGPGCGRHKARRAVLKQLGVQRVLEARDAARYRCVIDAQMLAGS
jgi:hypothetical protein